jgi:ribosome-associated protein
MEIFKLKEGEEYIELNNLLKVLNLVASGGEAKNVIKEGLVTVNGEVETRIRKKMRSGETFNFGGKEGKVG